MSAPWFPLDDECAPVQGRFLMALRRHALDGGQLLTVVEQNGELCEVTADGARSLHSFPAGLLTAGGR